MPHAIAHVFVFNVSPTSASQFFGKVGKTLADVWVIDKTRVESEMIARAHILDQAWIINELTEEREISERDIGTYREDARATFAKAKHFGVAAVFVSAPPEDRDDDLVEIHRMNPPAHSSRSTH